MQPSSIDSRAESLLARAVVDAAWPSLSPEAQQQAKRALVWWVATCLEGSAEPGHPSLVNYAVDQAGLSESTVLGSGARVTAELAALVNGRAAKVWEHEDKYWPDETIAMAVGCVVTSAVVAVGEALDVSGEELATAVASGIDLHIRLAKPLGLDFVSGRSTQNPAFVCGTLAGAAACAKLLGLDRDGVMDALGIAHQHAAGNFQGQIEGRGVALQAGVAARNAVESARFAAMGMTGPRASILGEAGFYAVQYPKVSVTADDLLGRLGDNFITELAFKAYPCGVAVHPALDAIRAIRSRLDVGSVESVVVRGPQTLRIMTEPVEVKRSPTTVVQAQFSVPWAVACALRDGSVTVDHFTDQALADPELRRLSEATSVTMSATAAGTTVEVTSRGRVVTSEEVVLATGHPTNPLPDAEIDAVFAAAATRVGLSADVADQSLASLRRIAQVPNTADLLAPLAGTQRA